MSALEGAPEVRELERPHLTAAPFAPRYRGNPRAYFADRRAELIESAETSTALAGVMLERGDYQSARELMHTARVALSEVQTIDFATTGRIAS